MNKSLLGTQPSFHKFVLRNKGFTALFVNNNIMAPNGEAFAIRQPGKSQPR